ncbi:AlpA family phage regulatory protein [Pseudomonas sp. CGJS7]|uniref:AlpA family phage regulatory protein n=1 Tax=Pseudomonas sp. CGJS7 TaxID=3109348 RepID=UPI00300A777F
MTDPSSNPLAHRTRPNRLLRLQEVKSRVGLSKSSIYERVKLGQFHKPVPLGVVVGRLESEAEE